MAVKNVRINTAAKAVFAGGKALSRAEVLEQLGLNPKTPPEAWLAIVNCGSNASALKPVEAIRLLDAGKLRASSFDRSVLSKIRSGG